MQLPADQRAERPAQREVRRLHARPWQPWRDRQGELVPQGPRRVQLDVFGQRNAGDDSVGVLAPGGLVQGRVGRDPRAVFDVLGQDEIEPDATRRARLQRRDG